VKLSMRDEIVIWLADTVLKMATKRTQARIHCQLIRGSGHQPAAELIEEAQFGRDPGE
jgi:hypothetical protein